MKGWKQALRPAGRAVENLFNGRGTTSADWNAAGKGLADAVKIAGTAIASIPVNSSLNGKRDQADDVILPQLKKDAELVAKNAADAKTIFDKLEADLKAVDERIALCIDNKGVNEEMATLRRTQMTPATADYGIITACQTTMTDENYLGKGQKLRNDFSDIPNQTKVGDKAKTLATPILTNMEDLRTATGKLAKDSSEALTRLKEAQTRIEAALPGIRKNVEAEVKASEQQRRIAELEAQLKAAQSGKSAVVPLAAVPASSAAKEPWVTVTVSGDASAPSNPAITPTLDLKKVMDKPKSIAAASQPNANAAANPPKPAANPTKPADELSTDDFVDVGVNTDDIFGAFDTSSTATATATVTAASTAAKPK